MISEISSKWAFWFLSQPDFYGPADLSSVFEQGLIKICDISSDTKFDQISRYLICPKDMKNKCNLFVFREGIKPLWEENINGGSFIIRLNKSSDVLTVYWEKLIKACGTNF